MAVTTSKSLRNAVMYCVYVRNYSPEGTFDAVRADLGRIRALGADILWLMPIHPVGEVCRKGTLGSPYAIRDYRAVNPEFGTLDDFKALVDAAHALGMRVIIDVVYNHTSPDSVLAKEHPQWFYHRPDGSFGNRVGDWSDIVDLDYGQSGLWEYQIDTLKQWAQIVDGFRCDVAPLVPLDFWLRARQAVESVRPGCLWLAESVEPGFIAHLRGRGLTALSDSEVYQAFDLCYDYDIADAFVGAATGAISLQAYADALLRQETTYPDNYIKLRFLENHDRPRAAFMIPDARALRNWTALQFFLRGVPLIYNGQEAGCRHRPSLFERDTIPMEEGALAPLIRRLCELHRAPIVAEGSFHIRAVGGAMIAEYRWQGRRRIGVFSLRGTEPVPLDLPESTVTDLIAQRALDICGGFLSPNGEPAIFEVDE